MKWVKNDHLNKILIDIKITDTPTDRHLLHCTVMDGLTTMGVGREEMESVETGWHTLAQVGGKHFL